MADPETIREMSTSFRIDPFGLTTEAIVKRSVKRLTVVAHTDLARGLDETFELFRIVWRAFASRQNLVSSVPSLSCPAILGLHETSRAEYLNHCALTDHMPPWFSISKTYR